MTAPLATLLHHVADQCHSADPAEWSPEERDDVLDALGPAAMEIVGLSARIRAAKVNGTPVRRPPPVKPARKDDPEPEPEPPADPPPAKDRS